MPSKYSRSSPIVIDTFLSIVCATCTTTDHGLAGHDYAPLNDAGKSINYLPIDHYFDIL